MKLKNIFKVFESKSKSEEDLNKVKSISLSENTWEIEYKLLQSQINPHFLYNTLDSIRSEALKHNENEIASMIERLSRFFRYSISSTGNFVKISEELNHINDYYYIQKFRFEERLEMVIKIDSEELKECYIPKMTLQPLIENAITHGLEKKLNPGLITIHIFGTKKKVYIQIEDNGVGIESELLKKINDKLISSDLKFDRISKNSGIALLNVNARLKMFFGKTYGIKVRSLVNVGTTMEIIVPRVSDNELAEYDFRLKL